MEQSYDKDVFFKEITLRICSSLSSQTALLRVYNFLQDWMKLNEMYFVMLDPELRSLRTIAHILEGEIFPNASPILLSEELWNWVRGSSEPIIMNPDRYPVVNTLGPLVGLNPEKMTDLIIPLRIDGDRVGHLALRSYVPNSYTEEHLNLLSSVTQPFALALGNALAHEEALRLKDLIQDEKEFLQQEMTNEKREATSEFIKENVGLREINKQIQQVAPFANTILILGETGTGKEVIANAIHYSSPRKNGPYIKVNCGAIPDELIDNELFGHEKGAFTGATQAQRGRFERASGGTIFLDEIGDLPLHAQARLLRVLQNHEVVRVGGGSPIKIDIRVIAATHRDLDKMVEENLFRSDLLFRLNVFPILIPPLRQRKEDIPEMVKYLVARKQKELGITTVPVVEPEALEKLKDYSWPGNCRELENVIESELIRNRGESCMTFDALNCYKQLGQATCEISTPISPRSHKLDDIISAHIQEVLERTKGQVHGEGGAAEILGINPSTLRSRIHKLGIRYKKV
ncbi:Transcriptional regulator containing GAF, AAA-type ATPase, and DNA-binding Fis domains [Desulfuromusa kysingii]|uniref:Transcriptional regulator containing GAF, AAA-type ATPase, and DNA-binding Fis domains n=1 Tax=Desulfuromusa kysingii TaxID=37625 RepID=A0A1H4A2V5_9BACT|nr:sigma 54-interacting transcriptional regulator [Desulfuromusa kysingii]SEA30296.1 Transcriptional regulator containing GAF, AAA-type ATPase, and DNA-binding Fis domains [Desulfuromusa kysingii]